MSLFERVADVAVSLYLATAALGLLAAVVGIFCGVIP